MLVEFHKMHGLGNDFVIFKDTIGINGLHEDQVMLFCDRRLGIGCDQLIICKKEVDHVKMKIYNIDGKVASFCGNATRCVVGLYLENNDGNLLIETGNGLVQCSKQGKVVTVNTGVPVLDWQNIPLLMPIDDTNELELPNEIKINSMPIKGFCLNVGNPHIVIFVNDHDFNMVEIGSKIENLRYFPQKINVNFAKLVNRNSIYLQVWERGSGLTLACGSGACASFYAAYKKGLVDNEVHVEFSNGSLNIRLDTHGNILMSGGYTHVFTAKFNLE